jgi:predicted phage baseplate assembly protein
MPLPPLNLDDRDFESLVNEARLTIARTCPAWTDLSAGDPGMVILELFAHLTEVMIYRLNRLPDKAYIEFLNLIGVFLQPPTAAAVDLRFSLPKPAVTPVEIPRGTRVTVARADVSRRDDVVRVLEQIRATLPPARTYGPQTTAEAARMIAAHQAGYML